MASALPTSRSRSAPTPSAQLLEQEQRARQHAEQLNWLKDEFRDGVARAQDAAQPIPRPLDLPARLEDAESFEAGSADRAHEGAAS